jgi:hypothetical protein
MPSGDEVEHNIIFDAGADPAECERRKADAWIQQDHCRDIQRTARACRSQGVT